MISSIRFAEPPKRDWETRRSDLRCCVRTNDIAELLQCTPSHVRRLISQGKISVTVNPVKTLRSIYTYMLEHGSTMQYDVT